LEPAVVLSIRASEVNNFSKPSANGQKGNQLAEVDGEFSDLGLWGRVCYSSFSWVISSGRFCELEIESYRLMLNGLAGTPSNWRVANSVDAWEKGRSVFEITHFQVTNKEIHAYQSSA
jgi:hypothetical protein